MKTCRCVSRGLLLILLLIGGVEPNPGMTTTRRSALSPVRELVPEVDAPLSSPVLEQQTTLASDNPMESLPNTGMDMSPTLDSRMAGADSQENTHVKMRPGSGISVASMDTSSPGIAPIQLQTADTYSTPNS
jgi:hypothetical protein